MDYSPFLLALIPALISCVAAVVSAWNAKKPASIELHQTVDEMVAIVEKMMREQRKVKMSNVRAAAKNSDDTGTDIRGDQQSVQHHPALTGKQALRERARAKGIKV